MVAVGTYKAAELGLFGEEIVGVYFFLGLQFVALMKCEGFAEHRKYNEKNSGYQCWQTARWNCCYCEWL